MDMYNCSDMRKIKFTFNYILKFFKWMALASLTGILGGLIGTLFHFIVEKVTNIRTENSWLIYLLPVGGLAIILICRLFKIDSETGTSSIMKALREDKKIPVAIGPVIFLGTAITHLFGGSAGREGAALQLGGSIGTVVGRTFKLDSKDMHIIILCGMSSVFAALFGTPLTAAIFALEVVNAGVLFYSALIPTVVSSLVATRISALFNISPIKFNMQIPDISFASVGEVLLIAAICAGISILFCITIGYSKKPMKGMIKNDYIRIFAGGTLLLLLTIVIRTTDYNGAGMDIIERALSGEARPEAFILKLIFTTITIAAGFRGGEIVPAFFIGSTLGAAIGSFLGVDPGFAAALGLVTMFCGIVNCPIASIFLSIELFGSEGLMLFALACAVSYVLSGSFSIYSEHKLILPKIKDELTNQKNS